MELISKLEEKISDFKNAEANISIKYKNELNYLANKKGDNGNYVLNLSHFKPSVELTDSLYWLVIFKSSSFIFEKIPAQMLSIQKTIKLYLDLDLDAWKKQKSEEIEFYYKYYKAQDECEQKQEKKQDNILKKWFKCLNASNA